MPTRIGELFEAYSCNVLCPCWIGQDPDLGECFAIVANHIDSEQVTGIDVSVGRMAARVLARPRAGTASCLVAWRDGPPQGRKRPAGSALLDVQGGVLAVARTVWGNHPPTGAGAVTVRVGILPAMLGRDPGELLAEPGSSDADFVASGSGGEGCCERVGRLAAGWLCLLWSRVTALGGWVGFALGRLRKAGIWPIGRRDDGGSYVRGLVVVVFGVVVLALGLVLERLA
jgi:hypothetical protein